MSPAPACLVNAAIEQALRDGAPAYEERGILLLPHLEAKAALRTEEPALRQALYTIFRGLADRLAPGATLWLRTRDLAEGEVELVWEAREAPFAPGASSARTALSHGPYGDLLELAIAGLETFCSVSTHLAEEREETSGAATTSFLQLAPQLRRRYRFVFPSLRAPSAGAAQET